DGKLGGQAQVPGVAGTWKDLTDNVNSMAANLTGQVRNIAEVTTAVAKGDLSKKITVDVKGEILELKSTIDRKSTRLNSSDGEICTRSLHDALPISTASSGARRRCPEWPGPGKTLPTTSTRWRRTSRARCATLRR